MGSSKKQTVSYWYRPFFQLALHEAPFDKLVKIRGGDVDAWEGSITATGSIVVDRPNLWGGEDKEGGIQGTFDVMFGELDAPPNAFIQGAMGPDPSNHNGVALLQFNGGRYGAGNPYPKSISVLTERIYAGWLDDVCWYPEKAGVKFASLTAADRDWRYLVIDHEATDDYSGVDVDDTGWEIGRPPFANAPWEVPPVYGFSGEPATVVPSAKTVWMRARLPFPPLPPEIRFQAFVDNEARLYVNGQEVIYVGGSNGAYYDEPISTEAFVEGDNLIAVAGRDWHLGGPPFNWFWFDWRITSDEPAFAMNPAHAIYDSLTYLQGEPIETIDDPSFRAAADRLASEGFGICTKFNHSQETIEQFRQRLLDLIGGDCSRYNGKWYLTLIRELTSEEIAELPVLTDDDILDWQEDPTNRDDAVNQVAVRWFDSATKQSRITPHVHSLAAINTLGTVSPEVLESPEVPYESLANRLALRELRNKSTPTRRLTLTTNRRPYSWRKANAFRLQSPKRGIADMVCRVADIERRALQSGAIRLVAVQDVFAMPSTAYVRGVEPEAPPSQTPEPIADQVVFEAPYVELAGVLAPGDLAGLDAEAGFILAAAIKPSNGQGYALLSRTTGGEFERAGAFDWTPGAFVNEASGFTDTGFTIGGGKLLPRVEVGTAALWGSELVRVDALDIVTGAISLGRACGDTVPVKHAAGERIYFFDAWGATDSTEYATAETVEVKLLPRTGTQELPAGSVPTVPVVMAQRAARPYPPANVKLNGESFPTSVEGDVEVTASHRDRLAQADQLIDQSVGDIGPEPGVRYTVRNVDASNDAETYFADGIVGFPHVVPGDQLAVFNRLEVYAERDGLESWQRHEIEFVLGLQIVPHLGVAPVGVAYAGSIEASNATAPVTWTVVSGSLPPGLALGTPSGESIPVTGTATTPGAYYFEIEAVDDDARTFTAQLLLEVGEVRSLIHFQGVDGATSITDERGVAWTRTGTASARLSSAQKKFGNTSGEFLDTTRASSFYAPSNLIAPSGHEYGPFTIQAWVYLPFLQGTGPGGAPIEWQPIVVQGRPVANGEEMLALRNGKVAFWRGSGAGPAVDLMGTTAAAVDTWNLVELGWDGSAFYLFLNGQLEASGASTVGWMNYGTTPVRLGLASLSGWETWALAMRAYIGEWRVIRGACLHTADYPLPEGPFADQA